MELYAGQSYRNILIIRNANIDVAKLKLYEPHENIGKKITNLFPSGSDKNSSKIAFLLKELMIKSLLRIKELNKKYSTHADLLFPWSVSTEPKLPSFHRKFDIDGAIISGIDFMHGIGLAARMETKKISGATGYSNTNLRSKLSAAINSLKYNDLVYIHINAPDEESHIKNAKGKVAILEKIDRELVKPLLHHLEEYYNGNFRLAILPDHYTITLDGMHGTLPVPYVMYGAGIGADDVMTFSEKTIKENSNVLLKSYEFMDFLLGQ